MKELGFIMTMFLAIVFQAPSCLSATESSDWFYNPFNKNSAHHRSIGSGAEYAASDHPATLDFLQGKALNINVGYKPWGCGIWESKPDDPLFEITYESPNHNGSTSEFPVTCRLPLNMVMKQRLDGVRQFDGVLVVYDRTADKIHHLRQFNWHTDTPAPNSKPTASSHKTWDIRGIGQGTRLGAGVGTSASGVAAMFGILRGWEVKATGHPIGHALQMVLPRHPGDFAMMLGREVWWPAVSMDGSAYKAADHNTGHIPYGSLWAIPPVNKGGPDLTKLGLSEKGLRLAECIRDYGIYVVDGGASPSIRADQDFDDELVKELKTNTAIFYKYIRMVVNSVPETGKVIFKPGDSRFHPTGGPNKQIIPGQFPAGGGTPLAPNTAIINRKNQ